MEIWIWGSIFWTSPWLATPKQSQTPSHMKFLVLTVDRKLNGKSPLFFTAEISSWVAHCSLLHLPRKHAKEISCTCAYIYIYWYVYTCDFEKNIIFKYKYIYIYTYIWYSMIYMYIHLDAICFNIDELYVMISIKRVKTAHSLHLKNGPANLDVFSKVCYVERMPKWMDALGCQHLGQRLVCLNWAVVARSGCAFWMDRWWDFWGRSMRDFSAKWRLMISVQVKLSEEQSKSCCLN